jgi:hypothetical protein
VGGAFEAPDHGAGRRRILAQHGCEL